MAITKSTDPFELERFVIAQGHVFEEVRAELIQGQKIGHWMWFIFPQISGLGSSSTSQMFAISSREEAKAYLNHPILGPRLRKCVKLVNMIEDRTASEIFGYPDDMKFRSCITLFANATTENLIFLEALGKYFNGKPDLRTLERL